MTIGTDHSLEEYRRQFRALAAEAAGLGYSLKITITRNPDRVNVDGNEALIKAL